MVVGREMLGRVAALVTVGLLAMAALLAVSGSLLGQPVPRAAAAERDAARIAEAVANSPADVRLRAEPAGPTADAPLRLRVSLAVESPAAGGERRFVLVGFLVRGAVACGSVEHPCGPMANGNAQPREGLPSLLMPGGAVEVDVAALLPDLRAGEYTVWAVAREAFRRKPGEARMEGLSGPAARHAVISKALSVTVP